MTRVNSRTIIVFKLSKLEAEGKIYRGTRLDSLILCGLPQIVCQNLGTLQFMKKKTKKKKNKLYSHRINFGYE